jgi:hypothetical protein
MYMRGSHLPRKPCRLLPRIIRSPSRQSLIGLLQPLSPLHIPARIPFAPRPICMYRNQINGHVLASQSSKRLEATRSSGCTSGAFPHSPVIFKKIPRFPQNTPKTYTPRTQLQRGTLRPLRSQLTTVVIPQPITSVALTVTVTPMAHQITSSLSAPRKNPRRQTSQINTPRIIFSTTSATPRSPGTAPATVPHLSNPSSSPHRSWHAWDPDGTPKTIHPHPPRPSLCVPMLAGCCNVERSLRGLGSPYWFQWTATQVKCAPQNVDDSKCPSDRP